MSHVVRSAASMQSMLLLLHAIAIACYFYCMLLLLHAIAIACYCYCMLLLSMLLLWGACPPRKILKITRSEIKSGVIFQEFKILHNRCIYIQFSYTYTCTVFIIMQEWPLSKPALLKRSLNHFRFSKRALRKLK